MGNTTTRPPSPLPTPSFPSLPVPPLTSPTIYLCGGCYWGVQHHIKKNFDVKDCTVGFISVEQTDDDDGKDASNVNYEYVCSPSNKSHVECTSVTLSSVSSLPRLLRFFMSLHDFTTVNRQGNDVGVQYGSYVVCSDSNQLELAKIVISEMKNILTSNPDSYENNEVSTVAIVKKREFVVAQREHQEYLMRNPGGYCNHYKRFTV